MDALPSLTRLSLGAGPSKDDALPTFAELDALDADETAAPPGYNEERALLNDRNSQLQKSYEDWKAGKPNAGETLTEKQKWEYKWYGDPYEILRRDYGVDSWNPRKVETQGFFDWAPSFWYDWKLVREQESLFAKANLYYGNDWETGMETFMHPASSVFDVIEKQLRVNPDVWERMLTGGAWIVDFSNMTSPDQQRKNAWSNAYAEAARDGRGGKGVVIAVVKPGSMEKRLFHDKKTYEGYVPDSDGQAPETEDYGRIWKLLEPLASDPRHVFLVVVETWPEEGHTKTREYNRDVKKCAFYKPDEYTEPQLQERGREGLGWPRTDASERIPAEREDPTVVTREEEIRRANRTPMYRGRYFPLEDTREGDQTWRPRDLNEQKREVQALQSSQTRLDHGFCEYDDFLCIMLRLWLTRKRWQELERSDTRSPWPQLDGLLPTPNPLHDGTYRVPANRGSGVLTTDTHMHELCHWQTMLKLQNEYFKFNDVFRLRVYRKTDRVERFERERTDIERQYGPDDESAIDLYERQRVKMDKLLRKAAIEAKDEAWEQEKKRFKAELKEKRKRLREAILESGRLTNPLEKAAAEGQVERLQQEVKEKDEFYNTNYRKTLEEWYEGDEKWPLLHRYGPQDVLKVQNDHIKEPRSLYNKELPKVPLWSPEAEKYMHDPQNVFFDDYYRWWSYLSHGYMPPTGQAGSPEIPEFLGMWRILYATLQRFGGTWEGRYPTPQQLQATQPQYAPTSQDGGTRQRLR